MTNCLEVRNLSDLREFVQSTLCAQNELEPHVYQMTERILLQSGRPCGVYFCLHGPRSVKLIAIWELDRNTVLFYGSSGERIARSQLRSTPDLPVAA